MPHVDSRIVFVILLQPIEDLSSSLNSIHRSLLFVDNDDLIGLMSDSADVKRIVSNRIALLLGHFILGNL